MTSIAKSPTPLGAPEKVQKTHRKTFNLTPLYTPVDSIPGIVSNLRTAFNSRKTYPIAFRKEQLRRLFYLLEDHEEEWVEAIYNDVGKCRFECAQELNVAKGNCLDMIKGMEQWLKDEYITPEIQYRLMTCRMKKTPKGVALVMSPFNYPAYLPYWPLVGNIAAGNCIALKPSEFAPSCAALYTKLFAKYLDPECYTVINGDVAVATAVLEQKFDHITYIGNPAVARIIATAAAKHLTPTLLELGGKNPAVIANDADLAVAAKKIAWGRTYNAGQACLSIDYVLISPSLSDKFISLVEDAFKEFYPGWPHGAQSDIYGRIVNQRHFDRIMKLLGPDRIPPSTDREDLFLPPTVLKLSNPTTDPLMSEEIFGPILSVIEVPDMDAAISFINSRPHPLATYVFGKAKPTREHIISNISTGSVCENDVIMQVMVDQVPLNGVGESGNGLYKGKYSIDEYSIVKPVVEVPWYMDKLGFSSRYPSATEKDKRWLLMQTPSVPFSRAEGSAEGVGKGWFSWLW